MATSIKARSLTEILNRAYKPLYFDMLYMEYKAGYLFRVYDSQSGEYYSVELSYGVVEADNKLLEKLIPQIEDFHKKHHNKLAKLLRGEE